MTDYFDELDWFQKLPDWLREDLGYRREPGSGDVVEENGVWVNICYWGEYPDDYQGYHVFDEAGRWWSEVLSFCY